MTEALAVTPKPELESKFTALKAIVDNTKIIDAGTYTKMAETKVALANYLKAVGFEFDPGIAKAKELLDHLKTQKAKFIDPAEAALESVKKALKAYIDEEERKTREENERRAAQERRDRELQAEQQKIADEKEAAERRREKVADIRGQLTRKEITKKEAERLLRLAGAIEEADKTAAAIKAEETKAAPAPAAAKTTVKPDLPKVAGAPRGRNYKFEITDAAKVPLEWCEPDTGKIGEFVRDNKNSADSMKRIPGIRAWDEPRI